MPVLALKLILTPLLIGGASLAARRWGPAIGGWLVSLPLTSGPVTFGSTTIPEELPIGFDFWPSIVERFAFTVEWPGHRYQIATPADSPPVAWDVFVGEFVVLTFAEPVRESIRQATPPPVEPVQSQTGPGTGWLGV